MDYRITDLAAEPGLFRELDEGVEKLWPPFMLQDPVAHEYFMALVEEQPRWQLVLVDGEGRVRGGANSVPVSLGASCPGGRLPRGPLPDAALPEEGWDWAIATGIEQGRAGVAPDALCGLQIAVLGGSQGKGLSHVLVAALRRRAEEAGFGRLVVPVRPTWKCRYPLTPMYEYVSWEREDGLPFDPWLRVHARAGARILRPCLKAMRIEGSVAQWEEWSGMAFPGSGSQIVPGALVPVEIDRDADKGLYVEPNVWVEHGLGASEAVLGADAT